MIMDWVVECDFVDDFFYSIIKFFLHSDDSRNP